MRTLSLAFRKAINAQESGEVPIMLLTVTHPDHPGALRLSSDPTQRLSDVPLLYATISRGQTFYFHPMEIVWPDEREDAPPSARLRISSVSRFLVPLLRSVVTPPPKVKIELVLASAPDDVEMETPWLDLVRRSGLDIDLTIELALNSMASEPYPAGSFDPASFPGLF